VRNELLGVAAPAHPVRPVAAVDARASLADIAPPDIGHHLGATTIALTPSLLIASAISLYLWGAWRVGRRTAGPRWSARRTAAFLGGMVLVFVSVELVVGVYDDALFYDHMVQHLTLIMLAAPLIAMGAPVDLAERATSGPVHGLLVRTLRSRAAGVIGHPVTGFLLYAVLVPAVHLTGIYNASLTNDVFHDNEHLAFLVIGYLFWRPVVAIEPSRHPLSPPLRLVYLMLAVPIDTFSGLVLMSANHEMFPAYLGIHRTWGPTLVGDLHVGGAVMWVAGDTLMVLAMIPVAVVWLRSEDQITRRLDAHLDATAAGQSVGSGT
jgi:putative copper resistance protein D